MFRPLYANDIIYGGLGNDSIHGGAGDDAILGGEAPASRPMSPTTTRPALSFRSTTTADHFVTESDFAHPFNPGNPLGYNPTTTKFAAL